MYFARIPAFLVLGAKHSLESRIKKCNPHLIYRPCWKAVDGKMLFNDGGGNPEGWDGLARLSEDLVEFLEMDLGSVPATPVVKFGVYSVTKAEDEPWFPTHNPANVTLLARSNTAAPWKTLYSAALTSDPATGANVLTGWPATDGSVRYFRFEILSRGESNGAGSHSYIKEVMFGHHAKSGPPPPPPPPSPMATEYALYFMPYTDSGGQTGLSLQSHYTQPTKTADPAWARKNNLTDATLRVRRRWPHVSPCEPHVLFYGG